MRISDWSSDVCSSDLAGLDQIFRHARTYRAWRPEPVSDVLLQAVYDLAKMGPTTVNSSPLRVAFLRSREAKEKLRPALDAGNVDKTMTAPVTAVIAYHLALYAHFPTLAPNRHVHQLFARHAALTDDTTHRHATPPNAHIHI